MHVGMLWMAAMVILLIALIFQETKAAPALFIMMMSAFLLATVITSATSIAGERVLVKDCQLYTQNGDRLFYVANKETGATASVRWSDIDTVHEGSGMEHMMIYEKRLLCFRSGPEYVVYLS